MQAKGIYPGAKVTRGPDWSDKYKDQDGKTIISRSGGSNVPFHESTLVPPGENENKND